MHFRVLYALAMALTVFSLFVLWVWTGPLGAAIAAFATHCILRVCEGQRDGELALARKERDAELRASFRRNGRDR
ncbi:hypothetical protein N8I71_10270 [Roseibacterium sp. SDUM158016]|jgi:hypothetical protein|uniref:hypothetical protein n=1 Tax=Roseicyclus sediminis TaxID=2980997 RepID=UPI0021CF3FD3|nr:hypothetical protein [Roseibacterium sp. SDUM158016]MCU4653219.1 hypothetical protein [Roseibacterium sp. SDUM158016]